MIRTCSKGNHRAAQKVASGGDTIDVGIEYGPMGLYRSDDTLGGFSYNLLRKIAETGNLKIKYHPIVTVKEALSGLEKGYFDIIVASIPQTTTISEQYSVTEPIFLDRQVLIQKKDSMGNTLINSQLDLAGQTIHIPKYSPVNERLKTLASEIGDTIYVVEENEYGNEQLVILVATGEIQYAVVNEKPAKKMLEKYQDLDISTAISFNQFQTWLLRKEDSLLQQKIDSLIILVREDKSNAPIFENI